MSIVAIESKSHKLLLLFTQHISLPYHTHSTPPITVSISCWHWDMRDTRGVVYLPRTPKKWHNFGWSLLEPEKRNHPNQLRHPPSVLLDRRVSTAKVKTASDERRRDRGCVGEQPRCTNYFCTYDILAEACLSLDWLLMPIACGWTRCWWYGSVAGCLGGQARASELSGIERNVCHQRKDNDFRW